VNVAVPVVAYPAAATGVQSVEAARVPAPEVHVPASILYPLLTVLKPAGMSQTGAAQQRALLLALTVHAEPAESSQLMFAASALLV
jgi:hypothetical protein